MADLFDIDEYDQDEPNQENDEDIEEVDYEEIDDRDEFAGEIEIAAPVAIPGKEESRTWGPDSAYGIKGTTAEGALGRKLLKFGRAARSPEERFRDNVERVGSANNAGVDRGTVDAVIANIGIIPDIQFKSPAGCLLGWMFRPLVGKKLTTSERATADAILDRVDKIKDKFLQIDKLNVIAYAKAWKLWMDIARGKITV
jgi:hypothetical protein